ncbi:alpha/beta fold hydrolase [Campylobacter pinnipediorum]|uniref:alpha/beta fold hydrolase n=1 Tax=Campylobacter pinnipediorum TaxID=1965231 RepID=UPI00084D4BB3|nr:alpha/beta hydrolase [Campylobacter pinnipediorum]
MASKTIKYSSKKYLISYEMLNPENEKIILFLHGWGASKEIMKKAFKDTFCDYKHIYVDMPGFGNSNIFSPLKTSDYSNIIREFVNSLPQKPDIILGHSFGGKVATLLNPKNLVLLSSAGIISKKPFLVRAKIRIFKILKFFGFGKFYRLFATKDISGMSVVMYETLKNVVDEDFSRKFKKFSNKAVIFWGENDRATPLKNGEFIHSIIKDSSFYPLSGDHFFFLLHSKFIQDRVISDINSSSNIEDESCIEVVNKQ